MKKALLLGGMLLSCLSILLKAAIAVWGGPTIEDARQECIATSGRNLASFSEIEISHCARLTLPTLSEEYNQMNSNVNWAIAAGGLLIILGLTAKKMTETI